MSWGSGFRRKLALGGLVIAGIAGAFLHVLTSLPAPMRHTGVYDISMVIPMVVLRDRAYLWGDSLGVITWADGQLASSGEVPGLPGMLRGVAHHGQTVLVVFATRSQVEVEARRWALVGPDGVLGAGEAPTDALPFWSEREQRFVLLSRPHRERTSARAGYRVERVDIDPHDGGAERFTFEIISDEALWAMCIEDDRLIALTLDFRECRLEGESREPSCDPPTGEVGHRRACASDAATLRARAPAMVETARGARWELAGGVLELEPVTPGDPDAPLWGNYGRVRWQPAGGGEPITTLVRDLSISWGPLPIELGEHLLILSNALRHQALFNKVDLTRAEPH